MSAPAAADVARTALRAAATAAPDGGWIVGGAVRDLLLGLDRVLDLDLAVPGDPAPVAAAVARALGAPRFPLSDRFGGYRVTAAAGVQVDVMPLHPGGLAADLTRRDTTINALALPLAAAGNWPAIDRADVIDQGDGLRDLNAGVLRACGPLAMADDPVRVLRLARAIAGRRWTLDGQTVRWARAAAPGLDGVAGERIGAELRLLLGGPRPLEGLAALERVGGLDGALPEVAALRGVQQSPYHHRDVAGHTSEVLAYTVELETRLSAYVDDATAAATHALLAVPLAGGWTGFEALRFAALLHDIAKPQTQTFDHDRGIVGFPSHDRAGRDVAGEIMDRLKAPRRVTKLVQAMTLHHLRLGYLVHARPLDRGTVYDYLRTCEPVEVEVTVLALADRLATRGRRAEEAITAHAELTRELLPEAIAWRRSGGAPAPLLDGDQLCAALGGAPGPWLAPALEAQRRARFVAPALSEAAALVIAQQAGDDR